MTPSDQLVTFLARASREFADGSWIFTGFHWPVVAAHTARLLDRGAFTQVVEAGGALNAPLPAVPSSTTDFALFTAALCYRGTIADTLRTLVGRYDTTVLDAGTVDLAGQINSTAIGSRTRPKVRLAGGGGAPDAAAGARHLLLLQGGGDVRRIEHRVDNVTSKPGGRAVVTLITPHGVARLGEEPELLERAETEGGEKLAARLEELGAEVGRAEPLREADEEERGAATQALREAAAAGYLAAR